MTGTGASRLKVCEREYLVAIADDEHMIGARHTAWIGLGPFLEEDLAFCSIAQDELGHAIGLYELVLRDEGRDPATDLDGFAMLRDPAAYRSSHLAEIECNAWDDSLVRHWLYDRAETIRWTSLLASANSDVAALAARALREEAFHLEHAERFMARVAGTEQIAAAVQRLLPLAVGAWASVAGEAEALRTGLAPRSSSELEVEWAQAVEADAARWGIDLVWPDQAVVEPHADRTQRSDRFDEFHAGLTQVISLDPAATW